MAHIRSYGFIGLFTLALCAVSSFATNVIERGTALVVAFIDAFAKPFAVLPRLDEGFGGFIGRPLAYDGPTIDLRHEAHTSRRSAERHV